MPIIATVSETAADEIALLYNGMLKGSRGALFQAVNDTSRNVRKRLGQIIRKELNIKKAVGDKTIRILREPTKAEPIAGIRISGRLIPLSRFSPVQLKRKGVVATTFKAEGRKEFAASFGVKPRVGPLGGQPFSRQRQRGNVQSGPISGRTPIHKLFGPSAADAIKRRPGQFEAVIADIESVLEKNLLSQVDRLLKRRRVDRPE